MNQCLYYSDLIIIECNGEGYLFCGYLGNLICLVNWIGGHL